MQTIDRVSTSYQEQGKTDESKEPFDYPKAFSRNLGLVQPDEQLQLKRSVVAIAGLGGVGGVHLTTLARLGVGGFHIADFDSFEVQNFNRQAGATVSSLGRSKVDVMAEQLLDINPTVKLQRFEKGVQRGNVAAFLDGVDVIVDGLDFFAVEARELLFDEAERRGIPLVTAGPIGMSVAWLVFRPGSMSWRDYFAFDLARGKTDKFLLFALGLTPQATQMSYLDRTYVNLEEHRGPSMALAVQLCAGVAAAEVLKLILKRGPISSAPHYHQFDAYKGKLVEGKLRWGNRGWGQRLKATIFRWMLSKKTVSEPPSSPIEQVKIDEGTSAPPPHQPGQPNVAQVTAMVDSARWAPSGDNVQPFSFEWDGKTLFVNEEVNRSQAFINVGNVASQMALGMCLTNIEIAAEQWGWVPRWTTEARKPSVAQMTFEPGLVRHSSLAAAIRSRCVDRRPFGKDRMSDRFIEKIKNQSNNPWGIQFHLMDDTEQIKTLARINSRFESFLLGHKALHSYLFHWMRWSKKEAQTFSDGMPISTLGLTPVDGLSLRLLAQWSIARSMKTMGVTRLAAIRARHIYRQSAAFGAFTIPNTEPMTYVRVGGLWQRVWLNLTAEGWTLQPVMGHSLMAHRCKEYEGEGLTIQERERFEREDKEIHEIMGALQSQTIACLFRMGRPRSPVSSRAPRRALSSLLSFRKKTA
ncbi:MAG: ThiF family adenylyltransferase [Elusimicrobia bacterium]|jgi:molybdopterin/thiamine biosynthesis adenylyltransferase|nr:ThiF family adenylyltransferase [Elusimicrobiota bacterium]